MVVSSLDLVWWFTSRFRRCAHRHGRYTVGCGRCTIGCGIYIVIYAEESLPDAGNTLLYVDYILPGVDDTLPGREYTLSDIEDTLPCAGCIFWWWFCGGWFTCRLGGSVHRRGRHNPIRGGCGRHILLHAFHSKLWLWSREDGQYHDNDPLLIFLIASNIRKGYGIKTRNVSPACPVFDLEYPSLSIYHCYKPLLFHLTPWQNLGAGVSMLLPGVLVISPRDSISVSLLPCNKLQWPSWPHYFDWKLKAALNFLGRLKNVQGSARKH